MFPELRDILAAVGGGDLGLTAAVAAADTPAGPRVVVTTARGRGWLPPGATVPAAAVNPWSHPAAAAWVGMDDPVQVLREWADSSGAVLRAVVASGGHIGDRPGELIPAAGQPRPERLIPGGISRIAWQVQPQADALAGRAAELRDRPTRAAADDETPVLGQVAGQGATEAQPYREAMTYAWFAHDLADTDADGLRGRVLRYVAAAEGRGIAARAISEGTRGWFDLLNRHFADALTELRERSPQGGGRSGLLDSLYADEAALALLQNPNDAREAALYSAATIMAARAGQR